MHRMVILTLDYIMATVLASRAIVYLLALYKPQAAPKALERVKTAGAWPLRTITGTCTSTVRTSAAVGPPVGAQHSLQVVQIIHITYNHHVASGRVCSPQSSCAGPTQRHQATKCHMPESRRKILARGAT
jgi:hypothetical protein